MFSATVTDFKFHQYSDSDQRRTVDHYSLYSWCKDHDQGHMTQQIEQLYTDNLTATAYKAMARIVSILAGLHIFSNPTHHTRLMLIQTTSTDFFY